MSLDRNQCVAGSGLVLDHHRIGFGPAARNLPVEPAVRAETDRTHHAALEIIQTSQVGVFPDHVLDVVRFEGRQAGPSAFLAPNPPPGHPLSRAGASTANALSGTATDPAPPAPGAQAPCCAGHASQASRLQSEDSIDPTTGSSSDRSAASAHGASIRTRKKPHAVAPLSAPSSAPDPVSHALDSRHARPSRLKPMACGLRPPS